MKTNLSNHSAAPHLETCEDLGREEKKKRVEVGEPKLRGENPNKEHIPAKRVISLVPS